MRPGDLVVNELNKFCIVLKINTDNHVIDSECCTWNYPDIAYVLCASGKIESNPVELYRTV